MATRADVKPPGYSVAEAASRLHPDSGAWDFFMRRILKLPVDSTPAVIHALRGHGWRDAADPVRFIREQVRREDFPTFRIPSATARHSVLER